MEDKFFELSEDDMSKIISIVFMDYGMIDIDYSLLTEVIEHISRIPSIKSDE